ncbi:MAG: carboxypeptidase M32 [Gammaproteobacteria bacterium]
MKNAYEQLTEHYKKVGDLRHVYMITSWDEAAMMPIGGGEARGEALASLDVVIHEMVVNSQVGDWIETCSNLDLDDWQQANLREIKREYDEMTCLPSDFVRTQSVARAKAEQAWRLLRGENDWQTFLPLLEEVVTHAREEAEVRSARTGLGKYDALLETFEPGMRGVVLDDLFARLKTTLPDMVTAALDKQAQRPLLPLGDQFDIDKQRELGLRVMDLLGFDFDHGRLDVSHHPFCGGVKEDVRITTRYTTDNFVESLMAVVHETGHAMYEQGRPKGLSGQPVTNARSAGVHESQSLMMEMQIGRSRQFLGFIAPIIRDVFGVSDSQPAWSDQNLHRLYTRVERSLIRVDADELTYPLHVILRYEIERALIEGAIEARDIPALWDEKMMAYLERDTRGDYRNGCMQDVHWSASLFGYFPTYTLGAMMAAQQFAAMQQALPDVLANIGTGDLTAAVGWLRENIHNQGSRLKTAELMTEATGETLNADYFLSHLQRRYVDNV